MRDRGICALFPKIAQKINDSAFTMPHKKSIERTSKCQMRTPKKKKKKDGVFHLTHPHHNFFHLGLRVGGVLFAHNTRIKTNHSHWSVIYSSQLALVFHSRSDNYVGDQRFQNGETNAALFEFAFTSGAKKPRTEEETVSEPADTDSTDIEIGQPCCSTSLTASDSGHCETETGSRASAASGTGSASESLQSEEKTETVKKTLHFHTEWIKEEETRLW